MAHVKDQQLFTVWATHKDGKLGSYPVADLEEARAKADELIRAGCLIEIRSTKRPLPKQ